MTTLWRRAGRLVRGLRRQWCAAAPLDLGLADRVGFALAPYLHRLLPLARSRLLGIRPLVQGRRPWVPLPLDGTSYIVAEILLAGFYDHGPAHGPVRRVLDAGAHVGAATAYLAARYPEAAFACVEPLPANVARLRCTLAENHLRATIIEAALGATDGAGTLSVNHDGVGNTLGGAAEVPTGRLPVAVVSVPTLLERLGWPTIDVLKLDIEGGEAAVLAGGPAWLDRVGVIVGEAHHQYPLAVLEADLARRGFVVQVTRPRTASGTLMFAARRGAPVRAAAARSVARSAGGR
jgi:FkbM family methyltransferase